MINIYFSFFRAKLLQKEIKQSSGCCGGSNTNRQVREVESIYVFKIGKLILSSFTERSCLDLPFSEIMRRKMISMISLKMYTVFMKYLADRREL